MRYRPPHSPEDAVAVIAAECYFPGAVGLDAYWDLLRNGKSGLKAVEADAPAEPNFVAVRSCLDHPGAFDHTFFGLSPTEAALLDPQHRYLLELCQGMFDRAALRPDEVESHVGVFVGVGLQSYLIHNLLTRPDLKERYTEQQIFFANDKGFAGARLAHTFDFKGPCVGVDTACSTSLVAIYAAIQALRSGECDLAVAGGSSLNLFAARGYRWHEGGVSSRTGLCRPFSDAADGTLFGSGAGLVLLKRAEDALADGDPILAFVLNAASNNDGAQKSSFAAPSTRGQMNVIADCLEGAGISARTIGYVEAHGTGTRVGDPIEFEGLNRIFRNYEAAPRSCGLGSVKSNFGHLDVAAGIAGFLKVVLALHHRQIPPTLHADRPNAALDLEDSPFFLVNTLRDWPEPPGHPPRAGVSSFGIGGTNAHVVLEAAIEIPDRHDRAAPATGPVVFPLSAGSDDGLRIAAGRIAAALDEQDPLAVAQALHRCRTPRYLRRAVIAPDAAQARRVLEEVAGGPGGGATKALRAPKLAFLFPGQGGLGNACDTQLYRQASEFRTAFDDCAAAFRGHLGLDLTARFRAGGAMLDLTDTRINQAWTFAHSLAAHALLEARGLTPDILIGHSLGELSALCVAGALPLDAATRLIATRGALMARLEPGAMAAVGLPEAALAELLPPGLDIASVNGPSACVVSGRTEVVDRLEEILRTHGDAPVFLRRLKVTRAFHSHLIEPILDAWREAVSAVPVEATRVPVISNLDGQVLPSGFVPDPDYLVALMRRPVRFLAGLETLAGQGPTAALEVGSGSVLAGFAQRAGLDGLQATPLTSDQIQAEDPALSAMARLWEMGCVVDGLTPPAPEGFWARPALPPTPFERTEHWIEPGEAALSAAPPSPPSDVWRIETETPRVEANAATLSPLLRLGDVLVAWGRLEEIGHDVVFAGPALPQPGAERARLHGIWAAQPDARLILWTDGQAPQAADQIRQVMQGVALAAGPGPETVFVLGPGDPHLDYATRALAQTWTTAQIVRSICPADPQVLTAPIDPTAVRQVWHPRKGWLRWHRAPSSAGSVHSAPTVIVGQGGLAQAARLRWPEARAALAPGPDGSPDLPSPSAPPSSVSFNSDMAQAGQTLDALAIGYVHAAFGEDLARHLAGGPQDSVTLSAVIGIVPPFTRFFGQLLAALAARGLLTATGGGYGLGAASSDALDLDSLQRAVRCQINGFDPVLSLLDRCGRHLKQVLTGRVPGASVIFPDGALEQADLAFKQIVAATNFTRCVEELARWVTERPREPQGRRIRVLEVGAGKGELTWRIGPVLNALGCTWHFTDIGPTFVRQARETRARFGIDVMAFDRADISDLAGAALEPDYDLILGFDVVHATPDLERSLTALKERLAPGGALALIEATRPALWNDLIWGMTPEWWSFTDTDRRRESPLVPPETWREVAARAGFDRVAITRQPGLSGDDTYALITGVTADPGVQVAQAWTAVPADLGPSDHVLIDLTARGGVPASLHEVEGSLALAEDVAFASPAQVTLVTDDRRVADALRNADVTGAAAVTMVCVEPAPQVWDEALTQIVQVPRGVGPVSLTRQDAIASEGNEPEQSDGERMLDLWREVFGDSTLRSDQNFHDLGGDSLVAAQLVSWVRTRFGADISIETLFEHATPAGLARHLVERGGRETIALPVLRRWPGQGNIPLSETQKALWFSAMLQEDRAIYNIPGAIRLTGALDYPALTEALKTLLATHDVLRLRISEEDGMPVARLAEQVEIDLTPQYVFEADLIRIANAFGKVYFKFDRQMFTARLLRLAPDDHVLLVNMHHIVSDGWSLGLMVGELIRTYDRRLQSDPAMPVPAWRYVDFVDWERRRLTDAVVETELAFWRNYLKGAPAISPLVERAGTTGAVGTILSDVFRFKLEPELSAGVLAAADRYHMTPFMFLLSGFSLLIARRTGAQDIVVGTTLANRYLHEFEGIIGPFVNNVAIRNKLDLAGTIASTMDKVKASVLEAFAHGLLPFHRVVRDMGRERHGNVTPVIQVLFVWQNLEVNLSLPGLEARQLDIDDVFTKFSLSLFMERRETGLIGKVVFDAGVFSTSEIAKLIAEFGDLLRVLVAAESRQRVSDASPPPPAVAPRPTFSRYRLSNN
ncbi:condensation domain-containing protein [Consotaella aegiceratis]|uniref:condensation domain-containing protein n=1 Tax=Consotaella aegiceratis TaxID=3097961 RepID=UPI002F40EE51